jgi:hypothetical protein
MMMMVMMLLKQRQWRGVVLCACCVRGGGVALTLTLVDYYPACGRDCAACGLRSL